MTKVLRCGALLVAVHTLSANTLPSMIPQWPAEASAIFKDFPLTAQGVVISTIYFLGTYFSIRSEEKPLRHRSTRAEKTLFAVALFCAMTTALVAGYNMINVHPNFQDPNFVLLGSFAGAVSDDIQELACGLLCLAAAAGAGISLGYLFYDPTLYYTNVAGGLDMPLRVLRTLCMAFPLLRINIGDVVMSMVLTGLGSWMSASTTTPTTPCPGKPSLVTP